jgi:hypothetical protein
VGQEGEAELHSWRRKLRRKTKKKHFPPLIAKILLILVHMFFLPYVDILGWLLEGGGEAEKG